MFPRRCIALVVLLLALSVAFSHSTLAATLLVPEDSSLDDALTTAVPGDTVSVAGGTLEYGTVKLPAGIVLLSRQSQANTLVQLLAWNLDEPSVVKGFRFGPYYDWNRLSPSWLGVVVDNSQVSFDDCRFIDFGSASSFLPDEEYPGAQDQRSPLHFANNSVVSLKFCVLRRNLMNVDIITPMPRAINCHDSSLEIRSCIIEQQEFAIRADGPLTITDSTLRDCRGYALQSFGSLWMLGNLIVDCGPMYWVDRYLSTTKVAYCRSFEGIHLAGSIHLYGNTFVDNPVIITSDYYIYCQPPAPNDRIALITIEPSTQGWIERNLLIGLTGPAVNAPASVEVSCNDAWDGPAQYWIGGIGDVTGLDGNISEPPFFCGRSEGDYTLSVYSPAANAACGLMGAFPTVCDTKLEIPADDGDVPEGQPAALRTRLLGAAPNPFNPRTQIRFELEHADEVSLEILDVAGRLVRDWSWLSLAAGPHSVLWDAHDAHGSAVASGIYYLRMKVGGKVFSDRLALLR